MTSKNLYFKLMKEDLKSRLWVLSLISLGFFFAFPVTVAFSAGDIENYASYELGLARYTREMTRWLSFENGMTVFLMMLAALICGLSGFSYLNSRSKVDFYHSLPIRREKLYLSNYISGILMLAVPYGISTLLAVVLGISNGISGTVLWKTALAAYGLHLTYFVLMYTVVVIAAMMTGHLVVAFLGSLVFAFIVPLAAMLVNGYFGLFFHTFVWQTGEKLLSTASRISPVMEYTYQISRYMEGETVWMAAVTSLVISLGLALIGCCLYRRRPSESAGRAMAFSVSKPVIRIAITLISAMGLSAMLWSSRESTGWAVFGVICGAVISHCVIEIIFHFDFKKLFADKVQLIICIMVSLAILFVFRYDLVGYDRYLPNAGSVRSGAVQVTQLSRWVSYGESQRMPDGGYEWKGSSSMDYVVEHMSYTDTQNLLELAAEGIAHNLEGANRNSEYTAEYTERDYIDDQIDVGTDDIYSSVIICYTLNSGRNVYRQYTLNLNRVMPQLEKLYGSEEFQKGTFPLMSMTPEQVAQVHYSEARNESPMRKLTTEEMAALLKAYQQEFSSITPERLKTEYPIGLIRFSTETDAAALQWWRQVKNADFDHYSERYRYGIADGTDQNYYPVYPSCTRTIALLQEYGAEPGDYYKSKDIQSVTINWYRNRNEYGGLGDKQILITDPQEISQLKESIVGIGTQYYNPLASLSEVDVEIYVKEKDGTDSYTSGFQRGKVPEFIIERLTAPE